MINAQTTCIRVGYGCVAPLHEQKLKQAGVKTIGVMEIDLDKIKKIQEDGFAYCASYEKAAELKPTFWDICTPVDEHFSVMQAIIALDPQAHILVEKPICRVHEEAKLEELLRNFKGKLSVNENYLSSSITKKVKEIAFEKLKLKPTRIVVEMDKNRIKDIKNGRHIDTQGAFSYEGTHMVTIVQSLGEKFLPQGNIQKRYEDLFADRLLSNQGLAEISYEIEGVTVCLFSSMKGDIKHRYPPYAPDHEIPENDPTRYRVVAVKGIKENGEAVTVAGFYEPIKGMERSKGAVAIIKEGEVQELEIPVDDDTMGKNLQRVVDYFIDKGDNPCSYKEGMQAIHLLQQMLPDA